MVIPQGLDGGTQRRAMFFTQETPLHLATALGDGHEARRRMWVSVG